MPLSNKDRQRAYRERLGETLKDSAIINREKDKGGIRERET